jgi:hypothetical protein
MKQFSSTVIPPTPIKSRPIKGKGKRSAGMGMQKEGSGVEASRARCSQGLQFEIETHFDELE